jgi:anti-sigma B factor antagonist
MSTQEKDRKWLGGGVTQPSDEKRAGTGSAETAPEIVARHLDWRRGHLSSESSDSKNTHRPLNEDTPNVTTPPLDDPDNFDLTMHQEGDTLLVNGDIDLHQADKFGKEAEAHIRQAAHPRLDLSGVSFLDSAGLATLLALSKIARSENKDLRLVATGSPRRVLRITGIDRVLSLED